MSQKKAKAKGPSIDGVAQRNRRDIGDFNDVRHMKTADSMKASQPAGPNHKISAKAKASSEVEVITEEDVIESTRSDIDTGTPKVKWRARRKAKKQAKKEKWAQRHIVLRGLRRTGKIAGALVILYVAYFGIITWMATNNIIDRGGDGSVALQDNIQPSELRGEGDGRVNIMLLGVGGEDHPGGQLADSIIIASIDPFANELAMLSVPRDMYVTVPGYYSTRINAAHSIGEEDPDTDGLTVMQDTLEEVLGINIHYYARLDFDGFIQMIDEVGGVTITLDERVYDPNFDWEYGTGSLDLPAGENTLDGVTALLLSRARGATGVGLGISRGDFGRSERQRDILLALKDEVLKLENLANPVTLSNLIRTASGSAKTNLDIGEMLKLREILERIPPEKIISFGLDNSADNYLQSANIGGASVLVPTAGDFSEIQLFVRQLFIDGFIRQETPVVDVYNGSAIAGRASSTAIELESFGYTIGIIDNAPTQNYTQNFVYDLTNGAKPFTKELLAKRFNVNVQPASELPPALATTTSDFVIIVGPDDIPQEEVNF